MSEAQPSSSALINRLSYAAALKVQHTAIPSEARDLSMLRKSERYDDQREVLTKTFPRSRSITAQEGHQSARDGATLDIKSDAEIPSILQHHALARQLPLVIRQVLKFSVTLAETIKVARSKDCLNTQDTYPVLFGAITGAELGHVASSVHMPSSATGQLGRDDLNEEKVVLWRIRFHCAAFDYHDSDSFCNCCVDRDAGERQRRCQAIEVAARLYQSHVKEITGFVPEYWSALLHAHEFLDRYKINLVDIMHQICNLDQATEAKGAVNEVVTDSPTEDFAKEDSCWLKQECHDGEARSQPDKSLELLGEKRGIGTNDHWRPVARRKSLEVFEAQGIDGIPSSTSHESGPEDSASDTSQLIERGSLAQAKHPDLNNSTVHDMLPLTVPPGLEKLCLEDQDMDEHNNLETATSLERKGGRPIKRKAKKKKHKPPGLHIVRSLDDWDFLQDSNEVMKPFQLTSGDVLSFSSVNNIPEHIFAQGTGVRERIEEYHRNYIHICRAKESKASLQAMPSEWTIDIDIRCIDIYLHQVCLEQKTLKDRRITITEMQARPLNGISNERARLSLGQISPEEHVRLALTDGNLSKEARLNKVRTSLLALFDYTRQQFWDRYHLVPDERLELLDRLKRKLNGLGGRFCLPGYPRKMGEGFFEIFEAMQHELLQQDDKSTESGYLMLDKDDYKTIQEQNNLQNARIIVDGRKNTKESAALLNFLRSKKLCDIRE